MAPSAVDPSRPRSVRDYRLDFFRGMALLFIFLDHLPDNALSFFTLRVISISDAAEVFIFISGYTAAMVYGRVWTRDGPLIATARVWRRAWQLYVTHLCLFLFYNAEVATTILHFRNPLFADELKAAQFLYYPAETLRYVLTLQFQPSFLDILPLYIVLMLIFPLILWLIRRHWLAALLPSAMLWLAVQIGHVNLPGYPLGRVWYFNPLAWQFLFTVAAIFGHASAHGQSLVPRGRWVVPLAAVVVAVCGALQAASLLYQTHGIDLGVTGLPMWVISKSQLTWVRMVNMMAWAVLIARLVRPNSRFLVSRAGWYLTLMGQHSLYVFAASILLALLGSGLLTLIGSTLGTQIAVSLGGAALMLALALLLAWYDGDGRLPARPA